MTDSAPLKRRLTTASPETTRRLATASERLSDAEAAIASHEDKASRDYHAYYNAEVVYKRSLSMLSEWYLHRAELEHYIQEFDTRTVAPSESEPLVEPPERLSRE